METNPHGRAAFAFIFVTVLLDMLALGVVVPVLPQLVVAFRHGDTASAARIVGGFGFVWALTQFFAAPILGSLSDRFGRRPVILLSNLGLGLDYIMMALAPSLSWLFLGRMISGITAASVPTAFAYIADVTPPEGRAAKFGMVNAAFGVGFIIGPAVGGLLATVDLRFPFWASAALSLANFAYGCFILPESLPVERRSKFSWKMANPLGGLALLVAYPTLVGLVLAQFLSLMSHESLPSLFVLYTGHRYGWAGREVGLTLAFVGVSTVFVSAWLVGRVVRTFGERTTMLIAFASGIVGFVAYAAAPTGALFVLGVPFIGLWMMAGPAVQSLMTRQISPSDHGKLQGVVSSLKAITGMCGPVLFTQVFAAAIKPGSPVPQPGAPYFISAFMLVASWIVGSRATASFVATREAVAASPGTSTEPAT